MNWSISCALLALAACGPANPRATGRDGDPALFAAEVQPIVRERCAFMGCHGREGMPLTLYALDYLRMRDPEGEVDPTRPTLDERAVSPGELEHNRKAFAARIRSDDPAADRELFIDRLLPADQGGVPHAGVVVFDDPRDPELDTIRRFLESVE